MPVTKMPRTPPSFTDIMIGIAIAVALVVLLFLAGSYAARAQEVTAVDLRPAASALIEWLGGAALSVASALGMLAMRYVAIRTGLERSRLEEEYNRRLGDIIHRGIEYAIAAARNEVAKPDFPLNTVKMDNYFLRLAMEYVAKGAPEILGRFKISDARLQELILARMPAYFSEVPVEGGATSTPTAVSAAFQMNLPAVPATSNQPAPTATPAGPDGAANAG